MQRLMIICCGALAAAGAVSAQTSLQFTLNQPVGQTAITTGVATSLLGDVPAAYFGTVPASQVNSACQDIVNGQRSFDGTVNFSDGTSQDYTFNVVATGGCLAGPNAPAGSQHVFSIDDGSKVAVVCGDNASVTVSNCDVYVNNLSYTAEWQAAQSGGRRRLVQMNPNCPGCIQNCVCTNVNNNCFPGGALVTTQRRGVVPMRSLQVYFFGHRDTASSARFVSVTAHPVGKSAAAGAADGNATTAPPAATATAETSTLLLSHRHFLPIGVDPATAVLKHACHVRLGDTLQRLAPDSRKLAAAAVTAVGTKLSVGLYNPYTTGGSIIVNDVLASAHSDWLLDDLVPTSWIRCLPAVYQACLKPVFWLYRAIGPAAMGRLNAAAPPEAVAWESVLPAAAMALLVAGLAVLGASKAATAQLRRWPTA